MEVAMTWREDMEMELEGLLLEPRWVVLLVNFVATNSCVCVMEDYRSQEMEQEECPPLLTKNSTFHCRDNINIILVIDFLFMVHKGEAWRSWKHSESGYRHLTQSE